MDSEGYPQLRIITRFSQLMALLTGFNYQV
jgi:hypothetical protein